jgi:hypothetical protein
MAEKGMIVENPLELLPLFEGMQLLPDPAFYKAESRPNEAVSQEEQMPVVAPIDSHVEPQVAKSEVTEPRSAKPEVSENLVAKSDSVEPLASAETWILNVWVDESKKHWPEEFRVPMTALLSAIKMQGQAVQMEKVQVLNPFVFTDRHGIKEWALAYKPKSILIWANQTNLDNVPAVFEQAEWEGIPVFRLPAFSQVVASVDNKKEVWAKLKGFYNF